MKFIYPDGQAYEHIAEDDKYHILLIDGGAYFDDLTNFTLIITEKKTNTADIYDFRSFLEVKKEIQRLGKPKLLQKIINSRNQTLRTTEKPIEVL